MLLFWAIVSLGVFLLFWLAKPLKNLPPVVLVHGWMSSCEEGPFRNLGPYLERRGYRVACFNMGLLEKSLWPDPVGSAEKLREFVEREFPGERVVVVGHSLGGWWGRPSLLATPKWSEAS